MYKSPVEVIVSDVATEFAKQQDEYIYRTIQSIDVKVDKEELIRALQYDRDQYEKGYRDAASEFAKCKESLKHYLNTNEENGVIYIPKFVVEKMVYGR